jgi:cell division protein FtsL
MLVRRAVGPPPLVLRAAAIIAVPLLLFALVATGQKAVENYRLNQQADALRVEIKGLRDQNVQLQKDIETARTDTAIETIAREQLGLIEPGDHPVVLVSQPSAVQPAPPQAEPPEPPEPVWRQWLDYFFG